jgi:hypothetical protein
VPHPARWTPAILDAIEPVLVELELPVHDPFAGTGERLGALCDRLGLTFTGTEIEPEFIADPRVRQGDSTEADTYPTGPFCVVTSPVYPNGMCDHYEAKDSSRRHNYRKALSEILGYDRPLHPNNMGRYGNRWRHGAEKERMHWNIAMRCVPHWSEHVIVNMKDVVAISYSVPVVEWWGVLLEERHGYRVVRRIDVPTPGQRHGANGALRADSEAVLIAQVLT